MGAGTLTGRSHRHLPLQGRHDPNPCRLLRCRHRTLLGGRAHMRCVLAALVILTASVAAMPAGAQRVSFADTAIDALPKDFVTALTGQGKPGKWAMVEDASADGGHAIAQLDADPTDYRFPLA